MTAQPSGNLYLCATPVGNLADITLRALEVLRTVDLIAAEDTRHTRKLLSHYDIHTSLVSYHEHNKAAQGPWLLAQLQAGSNIAVVSDAGVPGIADPGADLVRQAVAAGIKVVPVPGANAALTALMAAGLPTERFVFVGFLPRQKRHRAALLAQLRACPFTLIMYEAPHRLAATLAALREAWGDRPAVVARELTKYYEEFSRGTLASLHERWSQEAPRGEFTLVVAGDAMSAAPAQPPAMDEAAAAVRALLAAGQLPAAAVKAVARRTGVSRRELYQMVNPPEDKKKNGD